MNQEKKVFELEIDDILPNRFQPRFKFQEQAITELSESIREHGVINPILVRRLGDKYEIIAGERRYKASVLAGKTTIPAIITELNDKDSAEVALIENVQRQDLTPIEEAVSYRKILDMGYLTQEQLADKLGKTQSTISNKLRLLNLDDDVQEALLDSKISERHARSILKITNKSKQKEVLKNIIANRLTVKKTDDLINEILVGKTNLNIEPIIQSSSAIEFIEPQSQNSFNPSSNKEDDMLSFLNGNQEIGNQKQISLEEEQPIINITDINGFNSNNNITTSPIIEEIGIKNEEKDINKINPGFVDVDYIEQNAKDIEFNNQNKNIINNYAIDEQLQQEEKINENSQPTSQNKFFNFVIPEEIPEEENKKIENENLQGFLSPEKINEKNVQPNILDGLDIFKSNHEIIKNTNEQITKEEDDEEIFEEIDEPIINYQDNITKIIDDEEQEPEEEKNNTSEKEIPNSGLKTVINTIRNCADTIEKYGFKIETEEYDFSDMYQVIFQIKK